MEFPYLFSPINIRSMHLKNRIVMGAMHLQYTPKGTVSDRLVDFYVQRARGGAGLIIVGGCRFDDLGADGNFIDISHDRMIQGLNRLTRAVQDCGARIAAQLFHAGRYAHSSSLGGRKPVSASAIRSRLTGETPRVLDPEEIQKIQNLFAQGAIRSRESGFDAVEISGSAGYLVSQFLSPITNQRGDAYGGSLDNRIRFAIETAEKVRKAVGPDYPVIMRIAGNEFMQGGNTNREAGVLASALENTGVDMMDVTGGWHETRIPQLTTFVPRRAYTYLAKGIKTAASVPVIASNRINDPRIAEDIVRNGEADLVTMARALIADPDLPNKALTGKSRTIYHCVACNQGCLDNIFRPSGPEPVTCLVNPKAGRENECTLTPAKRPKKVLVIGGGPAGMKAACTLSERGHRVILAERQSFLGGQILLNKAIPGRQEMTTIAADLINNLDMLNVEVLLGTAVDEKFVKDASPDAVVIATGARPAAPEIPGIHDPKVVQAWDVLSGKVNCGRKVVIVGGNAVGLETALFLAARGTLSPEVLHFLMVNRAESLETLQSLLDRGDGDITVIELEHRLGKDIGPSTRWTVLAELKRLKVTLLTKTRATAVDQNGLSFQREDGPGLLEADTVVLAVGSVPENALVKKISSWGPDVYTIGDALEPRQGIHAIREGYQVGLKI